MINTRKNFFFLIVYTGIVQFISGCSNQYDHLISTNLSGLNQNKKNDREQSLQKHNSTEEPLSKEIGSSAGAEKNEEEASATAKVQLKNPVSAESIESFDLAGLRVLAGLNGSLSYENIGVSTLSYIYPQKRTLRFSNEKAIIHTEIKIFVNVPSTPQLALPRLSLEDAVWKCGLVHMRLPTVAEIDVILRDLAALQGTDQVDGQRRIKKTVSEAQIPPLSLQSGNQGLAPQYDVQTVGTAKDPVTLVEAFKNLLLTASQSGIWADLEAGRSVLYQNSLHRSAHHLLDQSEADCREGDGNREFWSEPGADEKGIAVCIQRFGRN